RAVVRQLLDFSRQSDIFKTEADINDVISTSLGLIHHQAQTGGVDIRVEFWDTLPLIRIDRNQMQQVFLNLIYNGIQAMDKGGELVIKTEIGDKNEEDGVRIKITDVGRGIAPDIMDKIFEPFFTTKPSGEGTGLGLSVSYGIVADHGGSIDVLSKVGHGTTFTIWLPIESPIEIVTGQ
ncbi:MAG: ATP-binding protein, partial [Chloroflexota bacterium]